VISYEPSCCPIAIAIKCRDYNQTVQTSEGIEIKDISRVGSLEGDTR
jgi:hypothetical protein